MDIEQKDGGVTIQNLKWFDPALIFDCGQCFRFDRTKEGFWRGVAHELPLQVEKQGDAIRLFPCTKEAFETIWRGYFDLSRDYETTVRTLAQQDGDLARAAACCQGMRLLRQAPFETLISFVISANNNIVRIKKIIRALCERYGAPLDAPWGVQYAFPTPQAIAAADTDALRALGLGYRDRYVLGCAQMAARQETLLDEIAALPYEKAKKELCAFPGVGQKVADCIVLFSMDKRCAFPQDVWIRRVAQERYGLTGAQLAARFGEEAGLAQQMLFHAARMGALDAAKQEED